MSNQLAVIKDQLELIRPDFEQLNLTGLNFHKELEFAVQILTKNNYLAGANVQSIQNSIKNIALTGLSLNPVLKYCYLIPRKEKGQVMCLAEPSYMGLIKILTDTGSVVAISATIVYEKEIDSLDIQEGIGGHATHKHYFGKDSPGEPMACYTIAVLPNGMKHVGLIRPFQWDDIMSRSESVKSYETKKAKGEYAAMPTWFSDKPEMIRKTAIKNHYKYLPKTERAELIGHAIDLDNQANGIDFEKKEAVKSQPKPMSIDVLNPELEDDQKIFANIKALFEHDALPEIIPTVKGDVDVLKALEELTEEFIEGSLVKEKLLSWGKFISKKVEHYINNPIEEETTEDDNEEEY